LLLFFCKLHFWSVSFKWVLITDPPGSGATNNCSSSTGSQSGTWPTSEATEQAVMLPPLRGELLFQLCVCKCFTDHIFLFSCGKWNVLIFLLPFMVYCQTIL
jgi:hypothetical protein